jgi:hypothetical protein
MGRLLNEILLLHGRVRHRGRSRGRKPIRLGGGIGAVHGQTGGASLLFLDCREGVPGG